MGFTTYLRGLCLSSQANASLNVNSLSARRRESDSVSGERTDMPNYEFTDGMKRVLRGHPALPAEHTRELAGRFNLAQEEVCRQLSALAYPLERIVQELKAGNLAFFREGSDQDRKRNSGKKSSYRFAGFAPSHVEEFDAKSAGRLAEGPASSEFEAWQVRFLMGFTFDVIEQVALRVFPATGETGAAGRVRLAAALAEARRIRDEILLGNLLLVAKIVIKRGRFQTSVVVDDLFTAGTDGLMIAIGRYDPTVGQFSTYATPWITMAIDRFVAKTRSVIRIPIGMQEKVRQQKNRLDGEGPVAAFLIPEVQSLEDPLPGFADSELRLEDVVADSMAVQPLEALERADIASILQERLVQLGGLDQFIIAMRNDIGDAAAIAARLFREESALSLSRGRAIAASASKVLDEPARIRMIGISAAPRHSDLRTTELIEFALAI